MAKFDLHQLLSERSKELAAENQQKPAEEIEQLWVDVYDLMPSKENFYSLNNIDDLKKQISLVGILQPLLVQREGDKYRVKAGHRRRLACIALVEEGDERFRYVPCVIRRTEENGTVNSILDKLAMIFTNSYREKTDWEKMEESLQTEDLISQLRKEVEIEGRTREILADFMGISQTQLGRYRAIKNNLCWQLMEEFRNGTVKVSVAYELSKLSAKWQDIANEMLWASCGKMTIEDAEELQRREEAERRRGWTGEESEEEAGEDGQEAAERPAEAAEGQQDGKTGAEPEENTQEPENAASGATGGEEDAAGQQDGQQDGEQEPEKGTESAAGQQEPEKIIYVERKEETPHGCLFCHPQKHREVATMENTYLIAYEPEGRRMEVIDQVTGCIEGVVIHYCPMCGRKLL